MDGVAGPMNEPNDGVEDRQILLILVGLPGSGKTTFAEALTHHFGEDQIESSSGMIPPRRRFVRASQDDAPSRRRQECEALVRNGLKQGHNIIVDRVGFDQVQRSHFINIADQHQPRPRVYCLYLSVSIPTLEARLALRTSHPTLADPKTAMMVLADMKRQLRPPSPEGGEGFDKIYTLDESLQPTEGSWTADDITRVLDFIESEGAQETGPRRVIENRPPANYGTNGRGRGFDPNRARGRGRGAGYGNGYGGRGGRGGYGYQPSHGHDRTYPQPTLHPISGQTSQATHAYPVLQQTSWRPTSQPRDRAHPYNPTAIIGPVLLPQQSAPPPP